MAEYRKKPVVIEAVQFLSPTDLTELRELCGYITTATIVKDGTITTSLLIDTLEGTMTASVGDFIIKGVDGELYPCKPDIFKKTYEVV